MRRGARLAIDPGGARIGVATCDPGGLLATPLETVPAGPGQWERLVGLVDEVDAVEVVVGLPLRLSGEEGPAAAGARLFADELARRLCVPVRLVDERLTTRAATRGLRSAGRSSRSGRAVVDQAAAVELLQGALDAERATGRAPGEPVEPVEPVDGEGPPT